MKITTGIKEEIKSIFNEVQKDLKKGEVIQLSDNLYLKKTRKGYRQIKAPYLNDYSKGFSINNINWNNFLFGNIKHFLFTSIPIFLIMILLITSYRHDVGQLTDILNNNTKLNYLCAERINVGEVECTQDLEDKELCIKITNESYGYLGNLFLK